MVKPSLFILSLLLLLSCRKDDDAITTIDTVTVEHDYRETVLGTYAGDVIYYQPGYDPTFSHATVTVKINGAYPSHYVAIFGDIVSGPNNPTNHTGYNDIHLSSNYTFTDGKFCSGDSLIYSVSATHYYTVYAHYFLKRQ